MPIEVSSTIMDTKSFVEQVFNKMEQTGDVERRTWDTLWGAVLEHVLDGGQGPLGAAPEVIVTVQKQLRKRQEQAHKTAELCPAFHQTNRRSSIAFSEVWCRNEDPDGNVEWFHTESRGQGQHAEKEALQRLQRHSEITGRVSRKIEFYMNVSPCCDCAAALVHFKDAHPKTEVNIKFTSLFAHHATNHRRGLQTMAESGITLAVFEDKDWDLLNSVICKKFAEAGCSSKGPAVKKPHICEEDNDLQSPKKRQKV